jgi:hypothetical protein
MMTTYSDRLDIGGWSLIIIIKTVFNATYVIHGSEESQSRIGNDDQQWKARAYKCVFRRRLKTLTDKTSLVSSQGNLFQMAGAA